MVKRLFDGESRFWAGLSRLGALMALNLVTLLCCLPVFTAGAAFAALAQVTARMAEDRESGIVTRAFFRAFRANFRQATAAWLIALGVLGVLSADLYYALAFSGFWADFFWIFAIAGFAVSAGALMWLFPLIALYENPLGAQIANALRLALGRLPLTALLLALRLVPLAACLLSYRALALLFPLFLLLGAGGVGYASALARRSTFQKLTASPSRISRREITENGNGNAQAH